MKKMIFLIIMIMLYSQTFTFENETTKETKGRYVIYDSPKINIVSPKNYLSDDEMENFINSLDASYYNSLKWLGIDELEEKRR